MEELTALSGPEMVFGLIGPVGTDLESVSNVLAEELVKVRYEPVQIRVSSLLHELDRYASLAKTRFGSEFERIRAHMLAGTELRKLSGSGDIMALLAVSKIRESRGASQYGLFNEPSQQPLSRAAFIVRSLKHPDEVALLRHVYGRAFYLISAYSPRETRVKQLASKIAMSKSEGDPNRFRNEAEHLIQIDEQEGDKLGQSVRDSFPLADFFVDSREPQALKRALSRFVRILFDHPFETPTKDEFAMFHAYASALRSADLGRQVGVAITNSNANIVAVGCNEVPKVGGGLYWSDDDQDHRDFQKGADSSMRFRRSLLAQALARLQDAGWKPSDSGPNDVDSLMQAKIFAGTQLLNLLEFGRSVHAEMSAISEAALRGVTIQGCSMFTTTFPCHLCARHIISAGLSRVVYIEPYPKSLAHELYEDMIDVDPGSGQSDRVRFEPFVGVAPSIYSDVFKAGKRKNEDGTVTEWVEHKAEPRLKRYVPSYLFIEDLVMGKVLPQKLARASVTPIPKPN